MKPTTLSELIVCPEDYCEVHWGSELILASCGRQYHVIEGKPILVVNPLPINVQKPPDAFISQNTDVFEVPEGMSSDPEIRILNLGSGNVRAADPRVVSVDVLPNTFVDLVCEGERLPFRDNSFDYVTSAAVLEHVADPISVAKELRRVLKVGGIIQSTVAFNQPYHGFPSHYFNWTPVAMENYLIGDYELIRSGVAPDGTLAVSLTQSWDLFLEHLSMEDREELLSCNLGDALKKFRDDRSFDNTLAMNIPRFAQEQLSAAYEVVGRKTSSQTSVPFQTIKTIYETRRIVLLRMQEIEIYSLKLAEKNGIEFVQKKWSYERLDVPALLDEELAENFLKGLQQFESELLSQRERIIHEYLS